MSNPALNGPLTRRTESPANMRLLRLLFRSDTRLPMAALTFASAVSVVMVIARILRTGDINYGFLIWNLFLAWLPLVFDMLARELPAAEPGWRTKFLVL